ncbi:MAG: hypothetical protein VX667_03405 [Nitrospinota bacterium]|nr:hypothetical protein [Nitrospinota bacterium]
MNLRVYISSIILAMLLYLPVNGSAHDEKHEGASHGSGSFEYKIFEEGSGSSTFDKDPHADYDRQREAREEGSHTSTFGAGPYGDEGQGHLNPQKNMGEGHPGPGSETASHKSETMDESSGMR